MNLNCRSCRTSIPRKRRGNHKQTFLNICKPEVLEKNSKIDNGSKRLSIFGPVKHYHRTIVAREPTFSTSLAYPLKPCKIASLSSKTCRPFLNTKRFLLFLQIQPLPLQTRFFNENRNCSVFWRSLSTLRYPKIFLLITNV